MYFVGTQPVDDEVIMSPELADAGAPPFPPAPPAPDDDALALAAECDDDALAFEPLDEDALAPPPPSGQPGVLGSVSHFDVQSVEWKRSVEHAATAKDAAHTESAIEATRVF